MKIIFIFRLLTSLKFCSCCGNSFTNFIEMNLSLIILKAVVTLLNIFTNS